MSAQPARHLQPVTDAPIPIVVNPATGERMGELPEFTQILEDALVKAEHRIRYLDGRITHLERDEEAEARKHQFWAEAQMLHDWWALATGHEGTKFGAAEFEQILPRLRERDIGPIDILKAIAGAAFDPGTQRMKNGRTKRFDDFELVMRSDSKLRSFMERAPGLPDPNLWKRWLLDRIEAQLKH